MSPIHKKLRDWRKEWRDPALSALLALQLFSLFIATPLAAQDTTLPHDLIEIFILMFVALVVFISRGKTERILCILAAVCGITGRIIHMFSHSGIAAVLSPLGFIFALGILSIVVGKAAFGPGKVNGHRIRGAIVLYLNIAMVFAACYHLLWDIHPEAFTNLDSIKGQAHQMATMTYFSFTTLTSTGFGDIVPVNPFARSLCNMESVIGQLFPATLLARLVTLAVEHSKDDE